MVAVAMLRSWSLGGWLLRSGTMLWCRTVSRLRSGMNSYRTIEMLRAEELIVLVGGEHTTQHVVTVLPVHAIGMAVMIDTAQVFEIDVIDGIILGGHQVELTRHLVSQIHGFVADLCVCESFGGDGYRHHHHQGHHLLHNLTVLNC